MSDNRPSRFIYVMIVPVMLLTISALVRPPVSPLENPPTPKLTEPPAPPWIGVYGGTGPDYARFALPTTDGGYLVIGETSSLPNNSTQAWAMKLAQTGWVQWRKVYGPFAAVHALQTSDGGYLVAGNDASLNVWLLKLNEMGIAQWQRNYDSTYPDILSTLVEIDNHNYVFTGSIYYPGQRAGDAWVVKVDATGNIVWQKIFGGNGQDEFLDIAVNPDGSVVAAGYTQTYGSGSDDGWLIKLSALGDIIWQKVYGTSQPQRIQSVVRSADGGYVAVGYTYPSSADDADAWALKVDSAGTIDWQKTYVLSQYEGFSSIDVSPDGGYLATGVTRPGSMYFDAWIVKLDTAGDIVWQKSYGGSLDDTATSGVANNDSYIIAGYTASFGSSDAWIARVNLDGTMSAACTIAQDTMASVSGASATSIDSTEPLSGTTAALATVPLTPTIVSPLTQLVYRCPEFPSPVYLPLILRVLP